VVSTTTLDAVSPPPRDSATSHRRGGGLFCWLQQRWGDGGSVGHLCCSNGRPDCLIWTPPPLSRRLDAQRRWCDEWMWWRGREKELWSLSVQRKRRRQTSRRPTPSMQRSWAAVLLQLQHQPPLPCRLDAKRRRGVHWRVLGGVGKEKWPWLCSIRSIQHELSPFCAYISA
jgi:hypothetical protein